MDDLTPYLENLGLGGWRTYETVGSTNDIALAWGEKGAADWSLVVAESQTAGRGRGGRQWLSAPGCGLWFSLVLRPLPGEIEYFPRFTALAALGLVSALANLGLRAKIKWPNDVLLASKKVAGILVEANWQGGRADAIVVGMGVNVTAGCVPPADTLRYPATCIEEARGSPVNRWALLGDLLSKMREYRNVLMHAEFVKAWNSHLAMRGEQICFRALLDEEPQTGIVQGVNGAGELEVRKPEGVLIRLVAGEILIDRE